MAVVRASISKLSSSMSVKGGSWRVSRVERSAGWEYCRGAGRGRGRMMSAGVIPGVLGSDVVITLGCEIGVS